MGYNGSITTIKRFLKTLKNENQDIKQNQILSNIIEQKKQTEHEFQWMLKLLHGRISSLELEKNLTEYLDPDDIKILLQFINDKPLRYRNRAMAVLANLNGISISSITHFLYLDRHTINSYLNKFKSGGVIELLNLQSKRIKKFEKQEYINEVFTILHAPPSSYGINRTTWGIHDIKRIMADKDLKIGKECIGKIIKNAGYSVRKARKVLTSTDPNYREKLDVIIKILSNLKQKEKFFSIDEFGPVAIKIHGGRSFVPHGQVKVIPQWQKNKGSLIVTAALELSTNQITHFYSVKKNTEEMIKLLDILLDKYLDEECLYFSWDAASWHASNELYGKVEEINSSNYRANRKVPVVVLAPLPSGAQFLNVIESVFSGMARAIIHNSNYGSVEECMNSIDHYLLDRNKKFMRNPKRAGKKIWGSEIVKSEFTESNNCKDPRFR